MAKYLLTGVAGFIASRIADLLLEGGHHVVGIDNMNDAYDVRMKTHRLEKLLGRDGFSFSEIDICYRDKLWETLDQNVSKTSREFDAVINLAARAGVRASVENPWDYINTNITGTLNLLEYCKNHQIKKTLIASTSSVYGADAPLPTSESAVSDQPMQVYAASKKSAEILAYSYYYLYQLDITIVRYFTVYGPAGRPDMVMFRFAQWITEGITVRLNGDGEQSRGFTYIDDIARGTIQALGINGYQIINLGGHETITINQLLRMMEGIIGKKASVEYFARHPADMMANHADVDKAGELLGWEPQVSLQDGVTRLIDWYLANRSWAKDINTS
jgi:nucleoside-diphosphate-sugar epimerase